MARGASGKFMASAFVRLCGWRRRLHLRAAAPASCPRAGSRCAAFVWLWVALFLWAPGYGDHSRARRSVALPPPQQTADTLAQVTEGGNRLANTIVLSDDDILHSRLALLRLLSLLYSKPLDENQSLEERLLLGEDRLDVEDVFGLHPAAFA